MGKAVESQFGESSNTKCFGRSIVWLNNSRRYFDFRRSNDLHRQILLLKPFSELLLTIDVLTAHKAPWAAATRHLKWAWDLTEQGDYLFRLLSARPDLFQLASLYSIFRNNGYRNDRLDSLLVQLSGMRAVRSMELESWVRMSVQHAMAQLDIGDFKLRHLMTGWVATMPEPWVITENIAYSVTHEVFYATDFGQKASVFPNSINRYIQLWIPVWAKWFYKCSNLDVFAECIMVSCFLGGVTWRTNPIAQLLSHQNSEGNFPGPKGAGHQFLGQPLTLEEEAFFKSYHTTLVSTMATWAWENQSLSAGPTANQSSGQSAKRKRRSQ